MNEPDVSTHKCARCGTEYFRLGECDWCPDEQVQPIPVGTPTEEVEA